MEVHRYLDICDISKNSAMGHGSLPRWPLCTFSPSKEDIISFLLNWPTGQIQYLSLDIYFKDMY